MAGRKAMTSNAGVAAAVLVALLVVAAASGAAGICGIDPERVRRDCGSYCKKGSTEASPSGACCAAASGVQYQCLCQYRNYLSQDIDGNRAMLIPSQCGVQGAPKSCH